VPKVDSVIIKITPNVGHAMSHINTEKFFELVKMGFSAKRKMLINNLRKFEVKSSKFEIEGLKLEDIFKEIELNPKVRAENLTIDNWIELYTILTNKNLL
jgi:16S rRNA (adenine1518-N6/adenine1519-N6)-dimethyltransferase